MPHTTWERWRRLICCVALVMAAAAGLRVFAQPQLSITRVAWLHGCWQGTIGQSIVDEHWMAPRGGSMLGMSRTVRGSQTTSYEVVLLKEDQGRLAYQSHPSGQPAAVFLSREVTEASVIFENPQHDFPQRIGYRITGGDALAAWIEGTEKGQPRRIDYIYRRVRCE